jgi:tryptophan synthase alpha chain
MMKKTETENGRTQIEAAFRQAHETRTAALMPYFTLGYPDIETSLDIIEAMAEHGDLIELGVPFSDPLADGPTVQHSTQVALENGVTVSGARGDNAGLFHGLLQSNPGLWLGTICS